MYNMNKFINTYLLLYIMEKTITDIKHRIIINILNRISLDHIHINRIEKMSNDPVNFIEGYIHALYMENLITMSQFKELMYILN